MKSHCWRNSTRLEGKKEKDKVWPEIQSKNHRQQRKYDSQTPVNKHYHSSSKGIIEENSSDNEFDDNCRRHCYHQQKIETNLNYCDFPELGKIMSTSKRKNNFRKVPDAIVADDVIIIKEEITEDKLKSRKFLKRSERSQLFRINIQQILENQRSLKNSLAEKKIKCCDRIVETKGNKIYLSKAKKPTKLKQIIINEREKRKELRGKNHEPIIKIVHEQLLNIENLKIIPDPNLDLDCGRTLTGLNLIGNEYRNPKSDNLVDKIVENRKDISQRLENLLINTNNETHVINDDLKNEIANIQIDEINTQNIIVENVNSVLILKKEENFQNPAFFTYRDANTNNIRYSKKFREYCTNTISPEFNKKLEIFISELFRLQKKLYERSNVKGKYKRRFYTGFNEVEKHITLKKIKFVIIVPDLEKVEVEGGLDDIVNKLIASCRKQNIPICFGLSRRKLGYLTHRRGMVSCIGVSNFSSIEEKLEVVLNSLVEAINEFRTLIGELNKLIDVKKLMDDDLLLSERIKNLLKIIAPTT